MTPDRPTVPYGSWPSPFTAELVVADAVSLGEVHIGEQDVWWSELRPSEGGRVAIVRRMPGGEIADVLPAGFSARTRVHEYGGGAWCLHDDVLFFANWDDQRLYRFDPIDGEPPQPITPEPDRPGAARYADGRVTVDHSWVICVRETHPPEGEAVNEIVAVPVDGGGPPTVLVSGPDFVSSPRLSPDGQFAAWIQWNHPDMPWDGTELWTARIAHGGGVIGFEDRQRVAGGPDEAVVEPEWDASNVLHFVSDRSNWWNLYRLRTTGLPDAADPPLDHLAPVDAEVATPAWVFGLSRYALLEDGRILCALAAEGRDRLAVIDPDGKLRPIESPYTSLSSLQPFGEGAALVAASPTDESAVVMVDLDEHEPTAATFVVLRPPRELGVDDAYVSAPEPIAFATTDDATAYGLFYPPTNPDVRAPDGELPPLVVAIHGGPTSAARPLFSASVQYWTSRGFGLVDVNYRGSTGYGRTYRHALDGQWGDADVEDCVAAARYLADTGRVDPDRLVIRGGSAGGYTALCALTFHDRFSAGASLYGVTDLEALALDTHKFESRYTDRLVGPYPEARDLYVERSPIHHTDRLAVPLIVFQGAEDAIVPPAQAEMLVQALAEKGIPHAYLLFEGEQHGFRQAANIRRVLEAELSFYAQVFGFELSDPIDPVPIENG
jgi:dipeptidyl aminopeptidase/acylaminoacyl peptidase